MPSPQTGISCRVTSKCVNEPGPPFGVKSARPDLHCSAAIQAGPRASPAGSTGLTISRRVGLPGPPPGPSQRPGTRSDPITAFHRPIRPAPGCRVTRWLAIAARPLRSGVNRCRAFASAGDRRHKCPLRRSPLPAPWTAPLGAPLHQPHPGLRFRRWAPAPAPTCIDYRIVGTSQIGCSGCCWSASNIPSRAGMPSGRPQTRLATNPPGVVMPKADLVGDHNAVR